MITSVAQAKVAQLHAMWCIFPGLLSHIPSISVDVRQGALQRMLSLIFTLIGGLGSALAPA